MSAQIIEASHVASLIPNGATVGLDGFTMMGVADEVYAAIEQSFLDRGFPHDLTLVHPSGQSNREVGIERLAHAGLVKRIVGSHWGLAPRMGSLIGNDEIEGICLPQGQLSTLLRAIAAGRPGNLSKVGLRTFVDPRVEGGRVNPKSQKAVAPDHYVELVSRGDAEFLLFKSFPIDVAIIRATRADTDGNVTQDGEASGLDALALAQAVRNSDGVVICQTREVVERGAIQARDVTVPANLIDYLVPTSDADVFHRQTDSYIYDARLLGDHDAAHGQVPLVATPDELRMTIGRRGAELVNAGDVVNVGTGIPGDTIGPALKERDLLDSVTMSIESGVYGGVPLGGTDFGAAIQPTAIISHSAQFDFYNGGGVDIAFMGVGQASADGNVNVSKLGGRLIGCGGFIDILSGARRICFLTSAESRHPKFVTEVDHLSFNGQEALRQGQEVYLATEDFVLVLTPSGWALHGTDDDVAAPPAGLPEGWLSTESRAGSSVA